MRNITEEIKERRYFVWVLKALFALMLIGAVLPPFFMDGIQSCYNYKSDKYQNDFSEMGTIRNETEVCQRFVSKGDILTNLTVYLQNSGGQDLTFTIENALGKAYKTVTINTSGYSKDAWNTVAMDCNGLEKNREYVLRVSSDSGLDAICFNVGQESTGFLSDCTVSEGAIEGTLAVGFQFTWRYLTIGNIFEFLLKNVACMLLISALCYAIYKIEGLYQAFQERGEKRGIWYAVFFAVSFTLLVNPLDSSRMEVKSFQRVIGIGLANDMDVSRRISNFNHWFFVLAISFALFFLLINDFLQKERGEESRRMVRFADDFMVLANVHLALRCITYFNDASADGTVFSYSTYLILLIITSIAAYLVLQLEKNISVELYAQFLFLAFTASYPVAILTGGEWQSGKVLLGVQAILFSSCILFAKLGGQWEEDAKTLRKVRGLVISFSVIPFGTSFYIEFINILNQYGVFVAKLQKYYCISILLGCVAAVIFLRVACKRQWELKWWKQWAYPVMLFGIVCLSSQIGLEGEYNAHFFETANISILASDFLNFQSIPLVEHYGGHMMTGVWEAIIYALLNHDVAGAIFSPYAGYIATVVSVLFFYFLKYSWNEDIAFFVALLFPFYRWWQYFGLGMVVYLAILAYIKKSTYLRAAVVWLALIWCAVYRLDLGVAIGIASIGTLVLYVILYKKKDIVKNLLVTLLGCGMMGGVVWVSLCMIKGVSPFGRLLEFLLVSLSNQNWAYETIGNTGNFYFAWMYILLPFTVAVCFTYVVFSKKLMKNISVEVWSLLLFMGISFFGNFSRGLVRHSLAEPANAAPLITWTAYIFLAVFFSRMKSNPKLLLPIFTGLILCSTLFLQDTNFAEKSFADSSTSKIGVFTDTWRVNDNEAEKTYWEKVQEKGEIVTRTKWAEPLENSIGPYRLVVSTLLDGNETFIDFNNKTFLYSALGRKNPVYVSQSPLQLSGEFTQEQFIKEMGTVPIILMPFEGAFNLDRLPDLYRYYKVSEHIFQNYVPLCKYGNSFAVWCLPERYEEMKKKVEMLSCTDYQECFMSYDNLAVYNCELYRNFPNGQINVVSNGGMSSIEGLENVVGLEEYAGTVVSISMDCVSNVDGDMKMYYTSNEDEGYTDSKAVIGNRTGDGAVDFSIPVTKHTRLKLVIPEGADVNISSVYVKTPCELIEYGYDGPYVVDDGAGNQIASYTDMLHNYPIYQLPLIWAEMDKEKAAENTVITELEQQDGLFTFDNAFIQSGTVGNYLLISAEYAGTDQDSYEREDEKLEAAVQLGMYENGEFVEKYQYAIILKEGYHEYLIRVSNDYYWYLNEVNAVRIQTDGIVNNVSMRILEGD